MAREVPSSDSAAARGLVPNRDLMVFRRFKELRAMFRQQFLVRGDDVFPGGERLKDYRLRRFDPADRFNDDADIRVIDDIVRVARDNPVRQVDLIRIDRRESRYLLQTKVDAGLIEQRLTAVDKDSRRAGADDAETDETDMDNLHSV